MKLTGKQLDDLRHRIAHARATKPLSIAEISRIAGVHPSQVSRICSGEFKTFSHNVMQVCTILRVEPERPPREAARADPSWARAQSSMRRLWDETPEVSAAINRLLDAIADLKALRRSRLPDS